MTIGIALVASFAAWISLDPAATITSILRRTSSAASAVFDLSVPHCFAIRSKCFFLDVSKVAQALRERGTVGNGRSQVSYARDFLRAAPRPEGTAPKAERIGKDIHGPNIQNLKSKSVSPDHLVRPRQDIRRNRQADLFGCS